MGSHLFCVGLDHNSTPQSVRKEFFLDEADTELCLKRLSREPDIDEALIVSTCNRLELYVVIKNDDASRCLDLFSKLQSWSKPDRKALKSPSSIQIISGEDAVRHAIMVVSGLNSMVVGETQISGQWKSSFGLSDKANCIGSYLNKLNQVAMNRSKKIRSTTSVGRGTTSLGHAAINLLASRRDTKNLSIAVVGGGRLGKLSAQYLVTKARPKSLFIINRTSSKAKKLVAELGFGEARDFSKLRETIAEVDVVITATSSKDYIITPQMVFGCERDNSQLEFIDLSLSGDVCPEVALVPGCRLVPIDVIGRIVNKNKKKRAAALAVAQPIIQSGLDYMERWLSCSRHRQ